MKTCILIYDLSEKVLLLLPEEVQGAVNTPLRKDGEPGNLSLIAFSDEDFAWDLQEKVLEILKEKQIEHVVFGYIGIVAL